jgi:hypothetical protein
VSQVRILPGALAVDAGQRGFRVPVDWSWRLLVGALVGDCLASDDAPWLAADGIALILQLCWSRMEANAAYYSLLHAEVLRGDPDARAVSMEMWDAWGDQLTDFAVGSGLADHGDAFPGLLRTMLWGLFNESRLTGNADEDYRAMRIRQIAPVLAEFVQASGIPAT